MLGGLAEAPSCCLSHGPEASLLVSYKQLYVQGTLGGLADPDSDIPSSCSLGPTAYRPASYPPARPASGPRQGGQPGPPRPVQTPRPPPAQRAPLKHPQKAPADPAPSQKPPAGPAAPKKTGVLAPAPRKAPRVPAAPQNTSSAPVLCLEPLSLPTPSSQALTLRTRYRTAWDSAASGAGPAGSQPSGKTEPLMLVGAQETEVTEMEAARTPLKLNRDAVGTQEGGSGRGSVAKAGLPPETGVPKLLELEKMGGVAGWLQQSKESPQVLTPWPSRH